MGDLPESDFIWEVRFEVGFDLAEEDGFAHSTLSTNDDKVILTSNVFDDVIVHDNLFLILELPIYFYLFPLFFLFE